MGCPRLVSANLDLAIMRPSTGSKVDTRQMRTHQKSSADRIDTCDTFATSQNTCKIHLAPSEALRSREHGSRALNRDIVQVGTPRSKGRKRHVEGGQEEDHYQDQEASAEAVDSWQLEGERDH
jgi:hypothetical protein